MSRANIRTLNYAKPPADHYWRWSESRDAIEWDDGETVALWLEVLTVLNHLKPMGIPPLGSLLILIAACRDDEAWIGRMRARMDARLTDQSGSATGSGEEGVDSIPPPILQYRAGNKLTENIDGNGYTPLLRNSILGGLIAIHELPKEQRGTLAAKCHLASLIFASSTFRLSKKDTKEVLDEIITLGPRGLGAETPRYTSSERFLLDLKALLPGLARRTGKNLESLMRTGLENADLQPAPLPPPAKPSDDPKLLLERLVASGGECGAAAMVAKRAIAMMNFPGQVGAPRDLPVGGIADITNRGTIDRLLPGELAWDDLVLAARLVHNEALYFRREIPPLNVATAHTILLDRGLRLWGCGRVFSLGVALGLWHHPDFGSKGESIECVVSTGTDFEYLELDDSGKIASALEALVPSAAPDEFLGAWWSAAQIVDDPAVPEVSFITEKNHLNENSTRTLLGEIAAWIHGRGGQFRVIALGRRGELEVQSWTPGGNRVLFRGEMDLDEILAPPRKPEPEAKEKAEPQQLLMLKEDNPLLEISPIYGLPLLPFLFPLAPDPNAFLPQVSSNAAVGVTTNRRLAVWPASGRGARVISELPGRTHWAGRDGGGQPIIIASGSEPGEPVRVFRVNTKDGKPEEIEIRVSKHSFPRLATVVNNTVLLAYADLVEAFSLDTGRRACGMPIKSLPARPVLDFDGETIRVYEGGKDTERATQAWDIIDQPWPQMLSPEAASFRNGSLRILCGKQLYEFDPMMTAWKETSGGTTDLIPFHPNHYTLPDGSFIRTAGPSVSPHSVWLDPRGFICVGRHPENPVPGWCIMLSSPAASAWNLHSGLCSDDDRLRLPGSKAENLANLMELRAFLKQASTRSR